MSRRKAIAATCLALMLVCSAAHVVYADSVRSGQWHLDAMHAEGMWKTSTGQGVTVAVIDSGVNASHPDLQGQVLKGINLDPGEPGDAHADHQGHGTGMAAVIAGTGQQHGGDGAFGLAPGVKIMPVRVPVHDGVRSQAEANRALEASMDDGIRYAADSGAKVINISLAIPKESEQLTDAVRYALGKGSLIFASVGNDGDTGNALMYPAATPGVVGVGAVGRDGKRTVEAQHGPQVDLVAPGWDIVAACNGETGVCKTSGTSDATALVSASAALLWAAHPDWTNNQVLRVLLRTAGGTKSAAKRDDHVGYGAVRPRVALVEPGDPGPADVYPLPDLAPLTRTSPSASGSTAAPAARGVGTGVAVGIAVLVLGAALALVRSRRRRV